MSDGQMENGQGKKNERSAIRGGGWKKKKKESENTRSMQPGRGSDLWFVSLVCLAFEGLHNAAFSERTA